MMITSFEQNSEGFAEGSRIVADDWKDWNSPAMSREIAKLFRNKTCVSCSSKDNGRA
jgi:hypothetical protein